jgi:hypothetical protein
MNPNLNRIAGFATALVLLATCFVQAQDHTQAVIVLTGHPYSARRTITTTRALPDGTSAKSTRESLVWRDDQGRTREEQIQRSSEGEIHTINITDPITRQHLSWIVGNRIEKEVFVTRILNPVQMVDHVPGSDLTPAQRAQAIAQKPNPNMTAERLGPAIINGVKATGLRTITVIPPGKEGNDHELKRFHEGWRSTEREELIVRSIMEDPQTGTTDSELTEIDFSNPDKSLFAPPLGYRVQAVKP